MVLSIFKTWFEAVCALMAAGPTLLFQKIYFQCQASTHVVLLPPWARQHHSQVQTLQRLQRLSCGANSCSGEGADFPPSLLDRTTARRGKFQQPESAVYRQWFIHALVPERCDNSSEDIFGIFQSMWNTYNTGKVTLWRCLPCLSLCRGIRSSVPASSLTLTNHFLPYVQTCCATNNVPDTESDQLSQLDVF